MDTFQLPYLNLGQLFSCFTHAAHFSQLWRFIIELINLSSLLQSIAFFFGSHFNQCPPFYLNPLSWPTARLSMFSQHNEISWRTIGPVADEPSDNSFEYKFHKLAWLRKKPTSLSLHTTTITLPFTIYQVKSMQWIIK